MLKYLKLLGEKYKDAEALTDGSGEVLTYSELYQKVISRVDAYNGIESKRLLFVCQNSIEGLCSIFSALCAGKTVILIDALSDQASICDISKRFKTNVVMISEKEKKMSSFLQHNGLMVYHFEEMDCGSKYNTDIELKNGKIVIFTSGSTGNAKGIKLDIAKFLRHGIMTSKSISVEKGGAVYVPEPLSHLYIYCVLFIMFEKGQKVYIGNIIRQKRELSSVCPMIYIATPSLLDFVTNNVSLFENTKEILVAGGKCRDNQYKQISNLGKRLINIYGSTEMGGVVAYGDENYKDDALRLLSDVEIRETEMGFEFSSPAIMEGFFDEKGEFFTYSDVWYNPGDIIKNNGDGTYSVLGRSDDKIALLNGMNIILAELEQKIIDSSDFIDNCCVFYKNDCLVGILQIKDIVMNTDSEKEKTVRTSNDLMLIKDKELLFKQLEEFNAKQAYFEKIVKWIIYGGKFPMNSNGKLDRKRLESECYG